MKITAKNREKGFALVVTLSLMILLTVVAVGLLSLSSVSLRTTSHGEQRALARSNARLALIMAIGDLQKYAGPDRRITANASLLQGTGSTAVPNQAWVGVWRTDDATGTDAPGQPMVKPGTTGYSDGRTAHAFDTRTRNLGWLVSGEGVDPEASLGENDSVQIRSGTVPVRAPLVTVAKGRMAYWVSDESTKARLNVADPFKDKQPAFADADSFRRLLAPLAQDPAVVFTGATAIDTEEATKLISTQQLGLSKITSGMGRAEARTAMVERADDFTVHSRSVLADVVNGGLKADLTAYLEDGPQSGLGSLKGIADADSILDAALPNRTMAGPKYGMLRNWYNLRNVVTGNPGSQQIAEQLPNTYSTAAGKIVDPGKAFVKPLVQPVMAEAVYYQRHVIDTGSKTLVELIYPRVVLYNPFNAKLQTNGHIVHFDFRTLQVIALTSGGVKVNFGINMQFGQDLGQHLGFYIPPTTFEPGESLCFTAAGSSKITPITRGDSDFRANVLSASANPADLKCFSRIIPPPATGAAPDKMPAGFNVAAATISYEGNSGVIWNGTSRTQTIALHALSGSRGAVRTTDLLSGNGPPVVRQLSLDNYSRSNNGRWLVGYTPPRTYSLAQASAGLAPDSLLAFGGRFRYLNETYANRVQGKANREPWFASPLADHNIGAPNIHRWPNDNAFGLAYTSSTGTGISGGSGPHLYAYGPLAQARQWSEWLDPEVMPHRSSSGNYRTSMFTDASYSTSNSSYPIYDLPSKSVPLVSLGALQHVQLSPFAWHPTLVIGQSFPSPYLADSTRSGGATSSRSVSVEKSLWDSKVEHFKSANYDINGFDRILNRGTKDVLLNDLSYEVNQALWDRYFLSGIPRSGTGSGWKGDEWDPAQPLPNPRLTVNTNLPDSGSRTELTSFHRAARSLWLEGGFNVNSTSVGAWESLLRSFRGLEVPTVDGGTDSSDGTAYAGSIAPGRKSSGPVKPSNEQFWNAFRRLSDDEIHTLATAIVNEVLSRGPFLGVSDFVNRRLVLSGDSTRKEHAYGGVLQAAIDKTRGLNDADQGGWLMPTVSAAKTEFIYGAPDWGEPIKVPEPQNYTNYLGQGSTPRAKGAGAAAHLNQGDMLQQLGSVLVARGDTFVVRGYGEARDTAGKVTATAMCEAVVQRTPEPLVGDEESAGLNPQIPVAGTPDFGRKFVVGNFRWLNPEEI